MPSAKGIIEAEQTANGLKVFVGYGVHALICTVYREASKVRLPLIQDLVSGHRWTEFSPCQPIRHLSAEVHRQSTKIQRYQDGALERSLKECFKTQNHSHKAKVLPLPRHPWIT